MSDGNSDNSSRKLGAASVVTHGGRDPFAAHGFVNTPVYRGSTVLFPTFEKLKAYDQRYTYGRNTSPTTDALCEAIGLLEGGAFTVLASSGLEAVTTAILSFVEAGDEILMTDSVYFPTRRFCDQVLSRIGVKTIYYDPLIGADMAKLMNERTRLVFTESPGSQSFEIQDIPAIAKAARERDIWVLMDNTWATPLYFRAFDHGVDVSIQSATKYIVGHADALLGSITANDRAMAQVKRTSIALGSATGSEEAFLGLRGLRTLEVRLERHQRAGLEIAGWLASRSEVAQVLHPALPGAPGHEIWKRDFTGSSGLFSVLLHPVAQSGLAAMLDNLKLFGMGYSWGGYESLIVPFDCSTYRTATQWSSPGPALRLHIGLEDIDDLKADLEAGFERMKQAG
ncbi:MAG: cystathionine beta-lyase [Alphaproteobacteria bacterium]|nr:cystathionine beta-lyase [Alphaproteobacteria bacterium]